MPNIRKRNGDLAGVSAPVISVVSVAPRNLSGFAPSAFLAKRDMHEDEMEELVVGLIAVQNEFQELRAPGAFFTAAARTPAL